MAQGNGAGDSMLVISALSRPLSLGMLYDARRDQIVPGVSIWKTEDVKKATRVSPQPNTRFQVGSSECVSQRAKLLDVSASMKLSFYGGLIEAEGSAHYLKNQTSSHDQCSITLHYHQTTEFRELMVSELDPPKPEVFHMTDATHVVVSVLYGADALMEFQASASDASRKKDVQGNLSLMIKKIPSAEVSGDGSLHMSDEDKHKAQGLNCTFYGDVCLDSVPSTYEGAVRLYNKLPSLLGRDTEKAVAVKVWLCPLSKLTNTELKLKRAISEVLVSEIEQVMEDFHQARMRTNDLLRQARDIKADSLTGKLGRFQKSLRVFTTELLCKLSELIPAIRGGSTDEAALTDLLSSWETLGFRGGQMGQWLDSKETDINIVTSYINELQCAVKSPGPELDSFLRQAGVQDAFVFSFTSLAYEEPYLTEFEQVAKDFKTGSTNSTAERKPSQEVPWYLKAGVKQALDLSLRVFKDVHTHTVISFIPDPQHHGASVRWYHHSALKEPHVTAVPLPLYACTLTLDPNTAHKHLLLSENNSRATHVAEEQPYPDLPERFDGGQHQVLSREALPSRCYWECEWDGKETCVGVTYKSIGRRGNNYFFMLGYNDKSWCLEYATSFKYRCSAYHQCHETSVQPPDSRRVGVYLDRAAGTLSFYSVQSDARTHLHTFNPTFTDEPLHAGFYLALDSTVVLHSIT